MVLNTTGGFFVTLFHLSLFDLFNCYMSFLYNWQMYWHAYPVRIHCIFLPLEYICWWCLFESGLSSLRLELNWFFFLFSRTDMTSSWTMQFLQRKSTSPCNSSLTNIKLANILMDCDLDQGSVYSWSSWNSAYFEAHILGNIVNVKASYFVSYIYIFVL